MELKRNLWLSFLVLLELAQENHRYAFRQKLRFTLYHKKLTLSNEQRNNFLKFGPQKETGFMGARRYRVEVPQKFKEIVVVSNSLLTVLDPLKVKVEIN